METVEEVKAPAKKPNVIEEIAKLREELNVKMQTCMSEVEQMKAMQTTPPSIVVESIDENTVSIDENIVEMLACGPLLCPKCNLMLEGFSATGERTLQFKHPFAQSPKLGGKQCEYTGWAFFPPKISLKVISKPAKRG